MKAGRAAAGVLAALLALVGGALLLWGEREADPLRTGAPAPGFELPVLDGSRTLALDELRGRVVLLNFWATWCKPCEDEMPAMERLYRALAPRGLELLAVSVDIDPELVRAFRERVGISFPILLDADRRAARAYQSFRFPETFLIDAQGRIAGRFIGPRDWDSPAYLQSVERLLDANQVAR